MPPNGTLKFESHVHVGPVHLFDQGDWAFEFLIETLETGQVVGRQIDLALNSTSHLLIESPLIINVAQPGTEFRPEMGSG